MRTALVVSALALLIAPASAAGGGFATLGLSSLPNGTAPGERWEVELTVLQHGRSEAPVAGIEPYVTVEMQDGSARRRFPAEPTDRVGVYRAAVVFPQAGSWRYSIYDGFSATHRYPPVQIGGAAAAPVTPDDGPDLLLALLVALGAGLAAALVTRLALRPASAERPSAA